MVSLFCFFFGKFKYTWVHQGDFVPITPVFTMAAMKKAARKKAATKKAAMKKAAMSRLVNVVA